MLQYLQSCHTVCDRLITAAFLYCIPWLFEMGIIITGICTPQSCREFWFLRTFHTIRNICWYLYIYIYLSIFSFSTKEAKECSMPDHWWSLCSTGDWWDASEVWIQKWHLLPLAKSMVTTPSRACGSQIGKNCESLLGCQQNPARTYSCKVCVTLLGACALHGGLPLRCPSRAGVAPDRLMGPWSFVRGGPRGAPQAAAEVLSVSWSLSLCQVWPLAVCSVSLSAVDSSSW